MGRHSPRPTPSLETLGQRQTRRPAPRRACAVKEGIGTLGLPTNSGFHSRKNYYAPTDAPLVAQIKAAGGIILGKASLSEFTNGGDNINSVRPGFCRHPDNTADATGASSGGTGASIAANFTLVGIGTDTGGSLRIRSAHNALGGLRPTVGLVSRTRLISNNRLRDTGGPMARTVADLAILLDVIVGPDPADAATQRAVGPIPKTYTTALKGARLSVLRQVFTTKFTDPHIIANFNATLAALRAAGSTIVENLFGP
jgi:amidase